MPKQQVGIPACAYLAWCGSFCESCQHATLHVHAGTGSVHAILPKCMHVVGQEEASSCIR